MHPQTKSTIEAIAIAINKVSPKAKGTKKISIKAWDFMVLCEQGVSLRWLEEAINTQAETIAQKYGLAAIAFQQTITDQGKLKEPSQVIITFKEGK